MMVATVLAAGALMVLIARLFLRDIAAPVSVFAMVWCLLVGLFHLDMVSYDPVHPETWWAIAASAACFLLGGWSALLALPVGRARSDMRQLPIDRSRLEKALALLSLLGILGLILQMIHLERTVGLGNLSEDPVWARELHTNVKYWGYLNILNVANVALVVFYTCRFRRFRWWMVLPLLAALVSALLTTDRTRFFYIAIWATFVWWYMGGGLRSRLRQATGSVLILACLLTFFLAVGNHYERTYSDRFPEYLHFEQRWEFLAEPYIYLTGSIPALDALMHDDNPYYLGKFSLSPLITAAGFFVSGLEPVELRGTLYYVPLELNTYSYLQQFFQDFGWFGVLIGPFICGLISCLAYAAMRRRPTLFNLYLASLLAYCCTISIFVNMFTQEATWFFVAVGYLVQRYAAMPAAPA